MKRRIDIFALLVLIAAALNCGLIGLIELNALTWLFGGHTVIASRILYVIVAIAGLWCINLIVVQSRKTHSIDYTAPELMVKSNPNSLKDNPGGETVCSPYFSEGCINEDTDVSAASQGELEDD